ncbi:MAG: hypothetical protein FWF84_06135, partial [Kiritimatiellaeota bacterium]|nr:hypothetical protein [Kiritimatiellota bacterium]
MRWRVRWQIQWMVCGAVAVACVAGMCGAEVLEFPGAEVAGICGYRAMWDVPVMMAEDGARVVVDGVIKDRGGVAPFAVKEGQVAAIAFDAIHRMLLVRFPGAAEGIAAKVNEGFVIEKAEMVLPFVDEEVWPEGSSGGVPPEGGYVYRMNWGTDELYRAMRPTWHAIAYALRRPWIADPKGGPTYNAYVNGTWYWDHFGAQDETHDRVAKEFGPTPVNYQSPEGRMDITDSLADVAFGKSLGERLRRLSDCGFLVRKWETYDHRYYTGCYEWSTGTGPRAIIISMPKLVVTMKKGKAEKVTLAPAMDRGLGARWFLETAIEPNDGVPTAVMPTAEEIMGYAEKFAMRKPEGMPEWQWAKALRLLTFVYGEGVNDEPFWFEFVPGYIQQRMKGPDGKPDPIRVYNTYLDDILGRPYRGWNGFDAGPTLATWFLYRDALPLPVQEAFKNYWINWLLPDRDVALGDEFMDPESTSGRMVHPQTDQIKNAKTTTPNIHDRYYEKTGDWRGNKSFYRGGYNYTMSTMNFNNTASMGALLGGAITGSERALADGRHGQANFPMRTWTWFDGSTQEEGDDYYFGVTMRAQKMVKDFGATHYDRLMGKSMLLKGATMLADTYHAGLKRYVVGTSRTSFYHRLVSQDGLYSILDTMGKLNVKTDIGLKAADLPEGEDPFGHEFPPDQVARTVSVSAYAPTWYQQVIDERPLPFQMKSTWKRWGHHAAVPMQRVTYLAPNYGLYSSSGNDGMYTVWGVWRRKAQEAALSRDLGVMTVRSGINGETRFVNDAPGWIDTMGIVSALQDKNTLLVSASPAMTGLNLSKNIVSAQATVALYNYELPAPSWTIYVDGTKVEQLPMTCARGRRIVIHDGVTYLGIIPLCGSAMSGGGDVVLRVGEEQKYLDRHTATAALVIDNYIFKGSVPLTDADKTAMAHSAAGFVIIMADTGDYPDVTAFIAAVAAMKAESVIDMESAVHRVEFA